MVVDMNRRLLLTGVLLCLSLKLSAQQSDMQRWLNEATPSEKAQRLSALGVDQKAIDDQKDPHLNALVQWQSLRNDSLQNRAILFLPCQIDSAYLYLLAGDEKAWHVIYRAELDCHYDESVSVEISAIRKPSFDEVLVHHAGSGHGAGYSEQDLEIFDVANGKFKTVLEREEVVIASPTPGPKRDLIQHSTFTVIPLNRSRSHVVEETRSQTLNGNLTVLRRLFRWNASSGRYLPSKFIKIEASRE